jgi:hypothetical protein
MVFINEDELDDAKIMVGVLKVHVLKTKTYPIDQPM